jgi:hypothetical protein
MAEWWYEGCVSGVLDLLPTEYGVWTVACCVSQEHPSQSYAIANQSRHSYQAGMNGFDPQRNGTDEQAALYKDKMDWAHWAVVACSGTVAGVASWIVSYRPDYAPLMMEGMSADDLTR